LLFCVLKEDIFSIFFLVVVVIWKIKDLQLTYIFKDNNEKNKKIDKILVVDANTYERLKKTKKKLLSSRQNKKKNTKTYRVYYFKS